MEVVDPDWRRVIAEKVAQYNPLGVFEVCPICDGEMRPQPLGYACQSCRWRSE